MTPEDDREQIINTAAHDLAMKYDRGQLEHRSDFPTGGLGWFVRQVRDEALDLIAYTHHVELKMSQLRLLYSDMALAGSPHAERLWDIINEAPPRLTKGS